MAGFGLGSSKGLFDTGRIIKNADIALFQQNPHITDTAAPFSKGGLHDFYSNGDYWWPDPNTPDGLPYRKRDGETNPGNFTAHRTILRKMRRMTTALTAAYRLTGRIDYARKAVACLREFFLERETRMNPHLMYAQAIPGVSDGRGIGIIDTLHLVDVPAAIEAVRDCMRADDYEGLQLWFADYLNWMNTHPNGIEEREWHNNHSIAWFAQAASFARFTGDKDMLAFCREHFKTTLLEQMAPDGSFPQELLRTKPYNYSCFALDVLCGVCLFASVPKDDLWRFELPDGRGIRQGLAFLLPYLEDKAKWPYPKDIEHFDDFPVALPFLVFTGAALRDERAIALWQALEQEPADEEIRRNISIRCPYLFFEEE